MITRRLLYLNTHNLAAYAWRKGRLVAEGVFEANDDSLNRFSNYLSECSSSHFYLLANVAEEGHVLETIPFLQGSDRKSLIARKIGQHFLGSSLAAATSLGYEKTVRKNEKLLIHALTNPAYFEPWLRRLHLAGAPLAGIYTVAQLCGVLLKKLAYGKGRCLLLTRQDHSIRETYLIDGATIFSRMVPLADSSIAGIANSLASEAGKLQQYLIGQRLVGRNETLPVFIVSHPQGIHTIEKALPQHNQLQFVLLDSHQAAHALKLNTLPPDSRSEFLFLHLLAKAPPNQQLASEEHRHDFRLSQIHQALFSIGAIVLLGGLLLSAKDIYRAHVLKQELQTLISSEAELDQRYRDISATFPKTELDNETLGDLTHRYQQLKAQQHHPASAFKALSQALDRAPEIELDELSWKIESPKSTSTSLPSANQELTVIRGTVGASPGATTRQILGSVEHFVALLRADTANDVKIEQAPFDITSSHTIKGGDSEDETRQPRQFSLQITRKIGP